MHEADQISDLQPVLHTNNRRANRTSWRPGQSGNIKGRPRRGQSLTEQLRKLGRRRDIDVGGKPTRRLEALADQLWRQAISGNTRAAALIFERLEGKALPAVEQPEPPQKYVVVVEYVDPKDVRKDLGA